MKYRNPMTIAGQAMRWPAGVRAVGADRRALLALVAWAVSGVLTLAHAQTTAPAACPAALDFTLPRLQVSFDFGSADEATRHRYMRHFDLYTQRGGG